MMRYPMIPQKDSIVSFLRGRIPDTVFRGGMLDMVLRYYLASWLQHECPGATFRLRPPNTDEHVALKLRASEPSEFRDVEIAFGDYCKCYSLAITAPDGRASDR
jgi:hypothetical protein